MSKAKQIGTKFETMTVRYLREELGQPDIDRLALHGNNDIGDLGWLRCGELKGIVECKTRNHAPYPSDIEKWENETLIERENAHADFALLVVHRPGIGKAKFGLNWCWINSLDFMRMAETIVPTIRSINDAWVCLTIGEVCRLIREVNEND